MPIDNIAFYGTNPGSVILHNFADSVVVRVDLRPTDVGKFVVFGRVVIQNWDGDSQFATARLTTLDGKTELDTVTVRLQDGVVSQPVSLQAAFELGTHNTDPIVDLRCATFKGLAEQASLFVVQVDDLKNAGV
jgi:hypothetical protein